MTWTDLTGNGLGAQLGSTAGDDANDPAFLPYEGVKYIYFPGVSGTSGNHAYIAANAAHESLDVDVQFKVEIEDVVSGSSSHINFCGEYQVNGWRILFQSGTLHVQFFGSGAGNQVSLSVNAATAGCQDGVPFLIRAVNDISTEILYMYLSFDDGKTWELQDSEDYSAGGTNKTLVAPTSDDFIIGVDTTSSPAHFKFYYAKFFVAGALVYDIQPDDATEPFSSFLDRQSGATVTISRESSGRMSTVVDRDLFLLGGDDGFAVSTPSGELSPGSGSQTIIFVGRTNHDIPPTEARMVSSQGGTGFFLFSQQATTGRMFIRYNDGTNNLQQSPAGAEMPAHELHAYAARLDRATDELSVFIDGVEIGTPLDVSTLGSVSGQTTLGFGYSNVFSGNWFEGEYHDLVIFNRALTDEEIELISATMRQLNPPVDPGGVSLMNEVEGLWEAAEYSGSGNLLDLSGNSRNGVISGAKFYSHEGDNYLVGHGGTNTGDYANVDVPDETNLNTWETTVRFRPEAVENQGLTGGSSTAWGVLVKTDGKIQVKPKDLTDFWSLDSDAIPSYAVGLDVWVKVVVDLTAGGTNDMSFYYSYDDTNDYNAVNWTLINIASSGRVGGTEFDGAPLYGIGNNNRIGTAQNLNGRLYRVLIFYDGVAEVDVDFNDAVEPYNSFIDGTGKTVNVFTGSSDYRGAIVDKPTFISDGTGDNIAIGDAGALDINGGDKTIMVWARNPDLGQNAYWVAKTDSPANQGWGLVDSPGDNFRVVRHDGTTSDDMSDSHTLPEKEAFTVAFVNRVHGEVGIYQDGQKIGSAIDAIVSDMANTESLRIFGRTGGAYIASEFFTLAIWDWALNDEEVALAHELITG